MGLSRPRHLLLALPLVTFVVVGLAAPVLAPGDPIANDLAASLQAPSWSHPLGTDQLGRDQLSRLLFGARNTLIVTAAVLAISVTAGLLLGTVAGFVGGLVQRMISRLIDVALTLPSLVVALAVIGVRGPGIGNLVLALALTSWAPFARIAGSRVASLRRSPHVDALRVLGAPTRRIVGRHLLPVAMVPVLTYASVEVGVVVLTVATLSFLGLGISPPQPEWGQMLVDARPYLESALWLALPPGIAITAVVLAGNLIGERLADPDDRPSVLRLFVGNTGLRARTAPRRSPPRRSVPQCPAIASSAGPAALYRVQGLGIEFGPPGQANRVLDTVTYEVRAGETLALVGESGSGKTVAVLGPLGLLPPTATVTGTAQLHGRELIGLDEPSLRAIRGREVGVVFQDALAALNPVRTVGAQVDEAVRNAGTARPGRERHRTVDLLTLVGLPDPTAVAKSYPHQLSGGMRQRALIAIALAGQPALLVADEPTSALDVTVQAQVLALLRRLRDELGMAMIVISHDLSVVAELADTVAVMYAGRVVERAAPAELLRAPDHPYSRGLLDAVPRLGVAPGTRFPTMSGAAGRGPTHLAGCAFAPRCPHALPRCGTEVPPLEPIDSPGSNGGRRSACWVHPGVPAREDA
ncbi:MAG: dipeptide/oligopeptide/nickel ABC transporter permease/ATP-binding protein [Pseudonocardiaceae bacterium]